MGALGLRKGVWGWICSLISGKSVRRWSARPVPPMIAMCMGEGVLFMVKYDMRQPTIVLELIGRNPAFAG